MAAPAQNRPKTKLYTSLQVGTKGWEGRKTEVDVHWDNKPALSQWEYVMSAASAVLKSFQNQLWDNSTTTRTVQGRKRIIAYVYLSFIQHKRLELACSPDVASFSDYDTKISIEDPN